MGTENTRLGVSSRLAGARHLTDRDRATIRTGFFSTLITLVAQFLLGMGVNLFVSIPPGHPGADPPDLVQSVVWAIFHGPVLLVLHATLGLLIVLSGLVTAVRLVAMHAPRRLTAAAILGAASVLFAAASGAGFVAFNEDADSMAMASFFALAVLAYLYGLFATARATESPAGSRRI